MEQAEAGVPVNVRKDMAEPENAKSRMPGAKPGRLATLSVVMPCLNEQDNVASAIQRTIAAFDRHDIEGEIVVINDGSTDDTAVVVRKLAERYSNVRLIEHARPMGIGFSFWDGVQNARNDFVTMFPGDDENDPDDALLYYYLTRDVDIIVPFIHNVEVRSIWRRVISSSYRFVINMSFGMNLNYTNGTVVYNRAILDSVMLKSSGFLYQAELLIKLIRAGYLYAETPHFLSRRGSGKTKALTLKSLLQVTRGYFRLIWEIHVLRRTGFADAPIDPHSATSRRMRGQTTGS
jgi:glycosyltransferase involved in cell wall biosynthesis